jgi:16S rRNA (cytosine967-C5)-methyltransferase
MVKRYFKRLGFDKTEKLLHWGNSAPPLYFFINKSRSDDNILDRFAVQGVECHALEKFPGYYRCDDPYTLLRSEAFINGEIVIGDPAQSLASKAVPVEIGSDVLDLFAAPGGKAVSMASRVGDRGCIYASDISLNRLKKLKANLEKWQTNNVFIFCGDALKFASSRKFKYILADMPCSGTGTIRRHPELRWNLKETDIARQATRQRQLLEQATNLLEPGGTLVYSTCSLEPEENSEIMNQFLKQHSNFNICDVDKFADFRTDQGFYEVWPTDHDTDGSFVAVLRKESNR